MIRIEELNKKAVQEYIDSKQYAESLVVPISPHRALSQIMNPECGDNDVILLLAKKDTKLVGYVGILPQILYLKSGKKEKIGWLSALWVNPQERGQGIAGKLMERAVKVWNEKLLSADYVPATKAIYDRSGCFNETPFVKNGVRLYVKADFQMLLPPKKPIFKKMKWALKQADFVANGILNLSRKSSLSSAPDMIFSYPQNIDEEMGSFIEPHLAKSTFRRGKEELNVILNYPWLIQKRAAGPIDLKYYFSSWAESFENKILKVQSENGTLIAVLFFTLRNGSLKLPYLYFQGDMARIVDVVNYHVLLWNATMFTTFNQVLAAQLLKQSTPGFFKKKMERKYLISNLLSPEFFENSPSFQDGDGDCVFT